MKRSTDRILTTHMGSLPRPDMLADLLVAQAEGRPVDAARIPALTDEAMDHIVRRQLDCGIDVGNDGEMPRSTFFGYITGRMSGFGGQSNRRPILDMQRFPKWWQNYQARGVRRLNVYGFPAAIGPVRYESLDGAEQCKGRARRLRPRAGAPDRALRGDLRHRRLARLRRLLAAEPAL